MIPSIRVLLVCTQLKSVRYITNPAQKLKRTPKKGKQLTMQSRFLDACRRKPVDAAPVWLMRQAGRYMAEYRALREKYSILELIKTPELAAEVTMQPINAFDLDAAIIFADIPSDPPDTKKTRSRCAAECATKAFE